MAASIATLAAYGTPFDGTYYLTQSGTPDKPIVIKGAGDGEVIFDGDGCQNLFNLMGGELQLFRRHHRSQYQRRVPARAAKTLPEPAASR